MIADKCDNERNGKIIVGDQHRTFKSMYALKMKKKRLEKSIVTGQSDQRERAITLLIHSI